MHLEQLSRRCRGLVKGGIFTASELGRRAGSIAALLRASSDPLQRSGRRRFGELQVLILRHGRRRRPVEGTAVGLALLQQHAEGHPSRARRGRPPRQLHMKRLLLRRAAGRAMSARTVAGANSTSNSRSNSTSNQQSSHRSSSSIVLTSASRWRRRPTSMSAAGARILM